MKPLKRRRTTYDPYHPIEQIPTKNVWTYENERGIQIYVSEPNRSGQCVGVITWKYLEGALKRKRGKA